MCWLLTTCEEEGEWRRRVKGRTHFSLFLLHPFKSFFYHTRGSVQQQQLVITNWRDAEKKREREEGILFGREFECPTRETRNTHKFSWCFSFSLSLSRSGVFLLGEGRSRILNGWWCGCESTGGRLNLVPIEEGSGGRKKKADPQQWKKKHTHTHRYMRAGRNASTWENRKIIIILSSSFSFCGVSIILFDLTRTETGRMHTPSRSRFRGQSTRRRVQTKKSFSFDGCCWCCKEREREIKRMVKRWGAQQGPQWGKSEDVLFFLLFHPFNSRIKTL